MKNRINASATVEALLILPIVFGFFFSVIWLIDVFRIHSEIGGIVNDVGNNMVICSYAYTNAVTVTELNSEMGKALLSVGWSELYLRNRIVNSEVGLKIANLSCVMSDIFSEDSVDLKVTYRVIPPAFVPGFNGFILTNRFYSKSFIGHEDIPVKEYVYITKGTEVYHTSNECRALVTNVESVLSTSIEEKRNEKGGKYYPCEHCCVKETPLVIFITPYGTKYHYDSNCGDINTTIFRIPATDVGDRRKCRFCQEN